MPERTIEQEIEFLKGADGAGLIRIGVLGIWRGQNIVRFCARTGLAKVVAICDIDEARVEDAKKKNDLSEVTFYTDFDEFIGHDMDVVVLANFADEHAPYAVRCMEAGKHVYSEVLPCRNMKEAVALTEAVLSTGKQYFYAENYCYMPGPRAMRKLYREGKIGTFEYAEGEYIHNCEPEWDPLTQGSDPGHWRNRMDTFFYCTHSLGPMIHIAGQRPVSVVGIEGPRTLRCDRMKMAASGVGLELVTLENGAVLKSIHGTGLCRNSVWYTVYGSKAQLETAREDAENGDVGTLYAQFDEYEGENAFPGNVVSYDTSDELSKYLAGGGHGGGDFYCLVNMLKKLRGEEDADVIGVFEAMDMFLPGLFARESVRQGNAAVAVPDLRDPAERDRWCGRDDVRGTAD